MTELITAVEVVDVRFPTSRELDGSDAMNPDPDYSAAYVILKTDMPGIEGHGLTFTIGRGNEICCAAIEMLVRSRYDTADTMKMSQMISQRILPRRTADDTASRT